MAFDAVAPHIHTSRIMTGLSCDYGGFLGTFAPFFLASESPMAIACFRLRTFPPRPPGPLFSVPRFLLRIALSTLLLAALP
jgi:hypothetical protein